MSLTIIRWFLPAPCSRSCEEESSSSTTDPPAANLSIVTSQTTRKGQIHWHFGLIFTASPVKEENQTAASSWRARKAEGSASSPAARPLTLSHFVLFHLLSFAPFKTKKPTKTPPSTRRIPLHAFCKVILRAHSKRGRQCGKYPTESHGEVQRNWLQRVKHSWRQQRRGHKLPDDTSTSHSWTLASAPFKPGFPFKKSLNEMKKQLLPESLAFATSPGPQALSAQTLSCQNKKQPYFTSGWGEKKHV